METLLTFYRSNVIILAADLALLIPLLAEAMHVSRSVGNSPSLIPSINEHASN